MTHSRVTVATTAVIVISGNPATLIAAGEPSYVSLRSIGNTIAARDVRQNATANPISPESVASNEVNANSVSATSAMTTDTMIAQLGEWYRSETSATFSGAIPSSPQAISARDEYRAPAPPAYGIRSRT